MNEPGDVIEARGRTGQVVFDGHFVTIRRQGLAARLTVGKGEKRIALSNISAVQWKSAGPFVNGFIQFSFNGGQERRSKFGSQTTDAVKDENSVVFTTGQQAEFEVLRQAVEQALAGTGAARVETTPEAPVDLADQLERLAGLRERGILTDAEFAAQKARLLG